MIVFPLNYKAMFCGMELEGKYSSVTKCLEILFNKIWDGSFPKKF